jgi:hypothetical protein
MCHCWELEISLLCMIQNFLKSSVLIEDVVITVSTALVFKYHNVVECSRKPLLSFYDPDPVATTAERPQTYFANAGRNFEKEVDRLRIMPEKKLFFVPLLYVILH